MAHERDAPLPDPRRRQSQASAHDGAETVRAHDDARGKRSAAALVVDDFHPRDPSAPVDRWCNNENALPHARTGSPCPGDEERIKNGPPKRQAVVAIPTIPCDVGV